MDIKEFFYNEDVSDIKKMFLYYHATFKPSGITAIKIGKKGKSGYTESNFKLDAKEALILKFSDLTDQRFKELWKEMKDNFQNLNIDLMTDINEEEGRIIYRVAKNEILKFMITKIRRLKNDQQNLLESFLKIGPREPTESRIGFTGNSGDFFVGLGLLYKGAEYDSKGYFKKDVYEYPPYFVDIKPKLCEHLENISRKKSKRRQKPKQDDFTDSDTKEEIYRLSVKFHGKKDAKKVKVGITKFKIGTEFGGQEYKHLKFKCGNCRKKKFVIEDNQKKILRCANCKALNGIFAGDLDYFE